MKDESSFIGNIGFMSNFLVSIIIPTFGRPENLRRAIDSVLQQTVESIEIIVVDDNNPGSNFRAETEIVMGGFSDHNKVHYIKHDRNRNGSAARNTGLELASGEYISFLDDDDEILPNKISEQITFLEENKDFAACYCLTSYFLNNSRQRESSFSRSGNFLFEVLMLKHECNTSSFLFRADVIRSLNGFDESFTRHQDIEMLVRFFNSYLMGVVNQHLLKRHLDSRINMPSVEGYITIKSKFLQRFSSEISAFPEKEKRMIYAFHNSDLFFYCLRNLKISLAIRFYPGVLYLCAYFYNNLHKVPGILMRNIILSKTLKFLKNT